MRISDTFVGYTESFLSVISKILQIQHPQQIAFSFAFIDSNDEKIKKEGEIYLKPRLATLTPGIVISLQPDTILKLLYLVEDNPVFLYFILFYFILFILYIRIIMTFQI